MGAACCTWTFSIAGWAGWAVRGLGKSGCLLVHRVLPEPSDLGHTNYPLVHLFPRVLQGLLSLHRFTANLLPGTSLHQSGPAAQSLSAGRQRCLVMMDSAYYVPMDDQRNS